MKQHIIVKLLIPLKIPNIPFWVDFIQDKSVSIECFHNQIDDIFHRHNLNFWITKEFKPSIGITFDSEEIQAGLDRVYRIILKHHADNILEIVKEIKQINLVENARPILIGYSDLPEYAVGMSSGEFFDVSRKQIFLPQAHLFSRGNPNIRVAILDTGVDISHPEISGAIDKSADFVNLTGLETSSFIGDFLDYDNSPDDEIGHGTHVAGIIAGKGLKMPKGVAPGVKLIIVRVLATLKDGDKKVGAGLIDNINTGIKWAVDNGADVINMSLGVRHEYGGLPHEEVILYALSKGVTIVAASGNDGTNDKYYPGALPGVIAVGAVDDNDKIAPFSTYGAHISLVAPGTNILSSFVHESYAVCSGTSQAAPFVSGAIALIKSYGLDNSTTVTDNQVKFILKNTSDKLDYRFKSEKGGFGRINLIDSLKLLQYQMKQNLSNG
ncbi:Thermophilic serine proteinase [anaerobic digester metagenome]